MLKVFGVLTCYHVSEGKLVLRAKKGFFIAMETESKDSKFGFHLKEKSF